MTSTEKGLIRRLRDKESARFEKNFFCMGKSKAIILQSV